MAGLDSRIHSTEDARRLAMRRLPRMIFDFVDGAAGREVGAARNETAFDDIMLQPPVMVDVSTSSLRTSFLGQSFEVPFGIAPMGMCNLVCPRADQIMADASQRYGFPVGLSSAGSTPMEDMGAWAGQSAWFQLYFGQSREATFAAVERCKAAGYETLVLTVDVPKVSRRVRDLRNGFNLPFRMTPRMFLDFATHPRWSLSTLAAGVPAPQNIGRAGSNEAFDRSASRAGANWSFLQELRDMWSGNLIVKGVTSPSDAERVRSLGADAIYVSNHGGRQLDAAPPAIRLLPLIRDAVGPEYPLLFDSGVRGGEDVVKALALGADFVMLGRPALFALGADGARGLDALLDGFIEEIHIVMAQLGVSSVADICAQMIFSNVVSEEVGQAAPAALQIAAES